MSPALLRLSLLGPLLLAGAASAEILRYPDVSASEIAFVHDGDLYVVARAGGQARRLTSHPGQELFPKFSPDGRWIAFSGEYNGTRQVHLIPADGSTPPRQLTWYNDFGIQPPRAGFDHRVLDFTPDGQQVLFRANRVAQDDRGGRPYLVPVAGGLEAPLPVPETGGGMLSPDGKAYVYTPIDREFRTWKRYRGGRAQDVWIYDLKANDSRRLTDFRGTDNQPCWVGDEIFFTSDEGWLLNLWAIRPDGSGRRQVTDFDDYDVLFPSAGPDAVVFEKGGRIFLHEPSRQATAEVPIRVISDRRQVLPQIKNVAGQIQSLALAPKAERAIVAARGEIFSIPAKNGSIRNLTRSPAREIDATLSPDGRQVLYLSDESGEYELYLRPTDGSGSPRRLTHDGSIWRFAPVFSPDGKRIAVADKLNRLQVIELAGGAPRTIDQAQVGAEITAYAFAPDGNWLAYAKADAQGMARVWLAGVSGTPAPVAVTHPWYPATSPAFDPGGRWLYFVSTRDHNLAFGAYEFNYLHVNGQRVYAASLAKDGPVLHAPRSDEIGAAASGLAKAWDGKSPLSVEPEGMIERAVGLKMTPNTYSSLAASKEALYYLAGNPQQGALQLRRYDLDQERDDLVVAGVGAYALNGEGDKLLLQQGNRLALVEAKANQDFNAGALNLDRLELRIDPRAEWQQIYVDAWRILRDWFYDEGLHGMDWPAVRARYQPLIDRAVSRDDVDFVLGEMAGELNAGHVYVQRGDSPQAPRKPSGLLGAEFVVDASGYPRIAKIFPGENWTSHYRNPLREPGVDVAVGDYLIAVDGVDAKSVANVYQLLEGKGEQMVRIVVNGKPSAEGARSHDVRTVQSESNLRYLDWVDSRRAYVAELSGGRIGYVHLPNTAVEGNRELIRQLLPQVQAEALILDDRYNGGGFIPDRMIEVLARQRLNYWKRRGLDPVATPFLSHVGPKAMLVNGLSSSGGDALPYYFRKLGLGPVIGTRTWGGLIGISGNPGLVDGGTVLAATFRILSTEGQWVVENEGVEPDIEVIDWPHRVAAGQDPSVEKAVQVLLEKLGPAPRAKVTAPPAPRRFGERPPR